MSGTIVVDRIESDASYASSINIASPLVVSNTVQIGTISSANSRFAAAGGIEFVSARGGLPYGAIIDYAPGASQGRICVASGNTFGVQIGGTEYGRFSTVGLDLSTGSAQGIKFPATQNASSDPNTLDDYEEGAWTASLITSGTGFDSVTYSLRTGRYTKVGNLVNISLRFTTNAVTKGSASGEVRISGLPFTSSVSSVSSSIVLFNANWSGSAPNFAVLFDNSAVLQLYQSPAAGGYSLTTPVLVAAVATGGNSNYVYINLSYEVA